MPSDNGQITGRCYCGAVSLTIDQDPITVAYCHCADCRRWTGGPVGAFAAFPSGSVNVSPDLGEPLSVRPGIKRWTCSTCGSPLVASFSYLPDQLYVPLGILDQADRLPPNLHCHADAALPWLHISDELERSGGSGRDQLTAANPSRN